MGGELWGNKSPETLNPKDGAVLVVEGNLRCLHPKPRVKCVTLQNCQTVFYQVGNLCSNYSFDNVPLSDSSAGQRQQSRPAKNRRLRHRGYQNKMFSWCRGAL